MLLSAELRDDLVLRIVFEQIRAMVPLVVKAGLFFVVSKMKVGMLGVVPAEASFVGAFVDCLVVVWLQAEKRPDDFEVEVPFVVGACLRGFALVVAQAPDCLVSMA